MSPPNIVLIMTDSQAENLLGSCGAGFVATPNIDRLAASGLQFRRAYNACPLCTPARAALFTGLYPHTAGAWGNDIPLGTTAHAIGSRLQAAGYRSAYIGKWHLDGTDYFGTGVCPPGFEPEWWYDGRNYLQDLSPEERALWRSGLRTPEAIRRHGITREWTWAGRITDRALRFLGRQTRDRPFLLVVSYDEPHGPSVCPPPFCDRYVERSCPLPPSWADTLEGKPEHHRAWAEQMNLAARLRGGGLRQPLYFGCAEFVDAEIGRLLAAVDGRDDTIVVFTSDHGHYLGAHRLDTKGPALYEEVTRVPLIVRGPSIEEGARSDSLASHVDLAPTLLEAAGLPVPPALDGTSLMPVLRDPAARVREELLVEFHRFSVTHDAWFGFFPIRCLVTERHKLTMNLLTSDELYDLADDGHEMRNLIESPAHAGIRDELHARLMRLMDRSRDPFRGPVWTRRPWQVAGAFGWVEGERRPRPRDGVLPETFNYDTGMPAAATPASPERPRR